VLSSHILVIIWVYQSVSVCISCISLYQCFRQARFYKPQRKVKRPQIHFGVHVIADPLSTDSVAEFCFRAASGVYQCKACSYSNHRKPEVTRHIEAKHFVIDVNCLYCKRPCTSRRKLRRHLRTHLADDITKDKLDDIMNNHFRKTDSDQLQ
jgi:hypothetical protein